MEIGKVKFTEGEYLGQVSNGKANGFGRMKYNNGDYYIGEWKDNCQTGKGAKNTKEFASLGTFLNGKRQGKFCTVEKNVINSGYGKSSWYNYYYIGEYKNDLKNGHGVYVEGLSGNIAY